MCQALSEVMGIQQRTKREKPYSQVAYILVGSAGNLEPGMQYNFLSKDLVLTATLR